MRTTRTFEKLVNAWAEHPRIIDSEGGTRSGKTYSILQLLSILLPRTKSPVIFSVVSETLPHLKLGAIRDFKSIMLEDGRWDEKQWNATDHFYTFRNGSILEFFSADDADKVHGPARDGLFINECQNIKYEVYRQLSVRTRDRIVLDYNPTHEFWVHTKIKPRADVISIHSTYKDNDCLSDFQIAEIESNRNDRNWWRVYGEGKVGQLEGVVYDFEQIDAMPEDDGLTEIYGMDFGFTNDPTAIVHILADTGRKVVYLDEVCYKTRMLNSDIIAEMQRKGVPLRSVPIYADCAEPKSIAEIYNSGFNIIPCKKQKTIVEQIQFIKGFQMKVTKQSVNLIKELRNYTWAKDKDGNDINKPIDKFNHLCDSLRYGIFSHLAENAGAGSYSFSFNR